MGSAGNGGGSFDPGIETGYLRRATREEPVDPEVGAAPFDPGEGAGYDDKRARRTARRREREERERAAEERRRRDTEERQRRAELLARSRARGGTTPTAAAAAAIEPEPLPPETDRGRSEAEAEREPAPVTELRGLRPQRASLAARLEREREERRRAEAHRRARIEREREARERQVREQREERRRQRAARLRRDMEALGRVPRAPGQRDEKAVPARSASAVRRASRHPRVTRARRPVRRRALIWPTAKAGLAVTFVLGVAAGLGSLAGLPVPAPTPSAGANALLSSASLFGVDPGTPAGLPAGFVFPVGGSHDYGESEARFGAPRAGHIHEGQDVFAKPGTPLYAVRDGIVIDGAGGRSYYAYGGGNDFVMYSPTDDRSYVYLHMLHPSLLHAGDHVHAGQQIGQVGCTGSCDGPHLHFEIRLGRIAWGHETKPIDPLPYLRQWDQLTPGPASGARPGER